MSTMPVSEITEQLIDLMLRTKNNEEFLDRINMYFRNAK